MFCEVPHACYTRWVSAMDHTCYACAQRAGRGGRPMLVPSHCTPMLPPPAVGHAARSLAVRHAAGLAGKSKAVCRALGHISEYPTMLPRNNTPRWRCSMRSPWCGEPHRHHPSGTGFQARGATALRFHCASSILGTTKQELDARRMGAGHHSARTALLLHATTGTWLGPIYYLAR